MPSFLSALQGLFPLSLPKPQSPASSNTTSPARGPIPCVTLPPPGVQSHSEAPRHQKGSTGEPGGWEHTSLSARSSCWTAHSCARAQGLGKAALEHTPVTLRGKAAGEIEAGSGPARPGNPVLVLSDVVVGKGAPGPGGSAPSRWG